MFIANLLYRAHLNPGETIHHVAHTHPVQIYKKFISILFFGILLPAFFYTLMPPFWPVWVSWAGFGTLKMILLGFDWYYDALLVTNQSLIDIQWDGLFSRSSSRIEYHTIEGVSYEVSGFFATILNYGNLTIERTGSGKVIGIEKVSFPKKTEREILQAQNEFMRNKAFRDHQTLKDLLSSMIEDYSR